MRKNIALICVGLAAALAAQGCFDTNIDMSGRSFKDLCEISGGEINGENNMQCMCGPEGNKNKLCQIGTVCRGEECVTAAITGEICTKIGGQMCVNGYVYTCQESEIWSEGNRCITDLCSKDEEGCAICKDGDTRCVSSYNEDGSISSKILTCEGGKWPKDSIENTSTGVMQCRQGISCYRKDAYSEESLETQGIQKWVCGECADGTQKCENGKIFKCSGGLWFESSDCNGVSCKDNGNNTSMQCGECFDGSVKCEDRIIEDGNNVEYDNSIVFRCSGGQWIESMVCPDGLSCRYDDIGLISQCGECLNGEFICTAGNVQICKNGTWKEFQSCDSASCDSSGKLCGECNNNETLCLNEMANSRKLVCNNGVWNEAEICTDTSCTDSKECGICKDGETRCVNGLSSICSNGQWEEGIVCPNGSSCKFEDGSDVSIQCGDCKDGALKCENGTMFNCVNGRWNKSDQCPNGASCKYDEFNKDMSIQCGDCKDGNVKCENNAIYNCSSGKWIKTSECDNTSCKLSEDGVTSIQCGECLEGNFICNAGNVKTCRNGVWEDFQSCNTASCNSEGKLCGECNNNDTLCINDVGKSYTLVCNSGVWSGKTECNETSCTNNKECGLCKDGTTKCENGKQYVCLNGQWGEGISCGNVDCQDEQTCGECKNSSLDQCASDLYKAKCVDGQWTEKSKCDNSCKDGVCVESECSDKEQKCQYKSGTNIGERWFCESGVWRIEDCSNQFSCTINGESSICGNCANGTNKCVNRYELDKTIGEIHNCVNGGWDKEDCMNKRSCKLVDGNSVCGDCSNGDRKCECDGTSCGEYQCTDGVWKLVQLCGGSSCKDSTRCGACLEGTFKCSNGASEIGALKECIGGEWTESAQVCTGNHIIEATKVSFVEENITVLTNMPQSCAVDNKSCGSCLNDDVICHEINGKAYTFICKNGAYQVQKQCDKNRCSDDHKDCRQCDEEVDLKVCINNASFAGSTTECINGKSVTKDCLSGYSCKNDSDCGECVNNKTLDVSTSSNDCTLQYCVNGQKHVETKSGVSCSVSSDGTLIFGECITDSRKCEYGPNGEAYSVLCKNGIWGTPVKCASYCSEEDHKCH